MLTGESKIAHFPAYTKNPYNSRIKQALACAGVAVELVENKLHTNPWRSLSWAMKYDLVHWHWMNVHYQGRTKTKFLLRSTLFVCTLFFIRLSGTKMIMTVHNLVPHDTAFRNLHEFVNRLCGRLMHRLIVHNPASVQLVTDSFQPNNEVEVIEHVDYEDEADRKLPEHTQTPGYDAAFFGHVRPYKRLELLIQAIRNSPEELGLLVLGQAASQTYAEEIARQISGCERIQFVNEYLSDEDLKRQLESVKVAVFPYAESLCSGAAHLALGRGLILVAPRTTAFAELIDLGLAIEITSPITSDTIHRAIQHALPLNKQQWSERRRDYLARCQPSTVGARLKKVYSSVLSEG